MNQKNTSHARQMTVIAVTATLVTFGFVAVVGHASALGGHVGATCDSLAPPNCHYVLCDETLSGPVGDCGAHQDANTPAPD